MLKFIEFDRNTRKMELAMKNAELDDVPLYGDSFICLSVFSGSVENECLVTQSEVRL